MNRSEVTRLRRELARQSRRRERRRYPAALRNEAVGYARARRTEGATHVEIAGELGVQVRTLCNWMRGRGAFRAVEIVERPAALNTPAWVVTTPRGLRVDGLDLETLAALIARVG
ncbi:MAG: transposase [Thermoanaerobaculia bacterium]